MRIEWLLSATQDADGIADYISVDNPTAARAMLTRIDQAVARLVMFPHSGRKGRIAGTRELLIRTTPYVVVYSIERDVIIIGNVIHGARQWPPEE